MSVAVVYKLLAMFCAVALGWVAGRLHWLGRPEDGDPARVLSNIAFFLFVPALLFRTTVRLDVPNLPWRAILAFFVPVLMVGAAVYAWQRRRAVAGGAAVPAVRAITVVFGNSVQVGIPFATALFGEAGLAVHIAIVSLHALVLLSLLTVGVELDLARDSTRHAEMPALTATLLLTARNTLIHPVVLPVVAGLLWNATGLGLHPALDEALVTLAGAVVPVCLVLIGVTLAAYGLHGRVRGALGLVAAKLLLLPAAVLAVAHWGLGLEGVPLAVLVMLASLPTGSNALIFAQRYRTLEAETTAAIVLSTVGFALTASLWLAVLGLLGAGR